jgi:uncharacterized Zn finger protein
MTEGICPSCGSYDRDVIESRKRHGSVFRRCDCRECGTRYRTSEKVIAPYYIDYAVALTRIRDQLQGLEEELSVLVRLTESAIDLDP